jgi:integrase
MSKIGNLRPFDLREYGRPPLPTTQAPFAQIEWIFDKRKDRLANRSSKANYSAAKAFYLQHIEQTEGRTPYFLADNWDEFALIRFKESLLDRIDSGNIKLSSYTLTGHFSAVRQVMKEASAYGLLSTRTLLDTSWGSATSETDAHTSYSDGELTQVLNAIGEELRYVYAVASDYQHQATDAGRDPRIRGYQGKARGYGFGVESNMRWYFENVLGCEPIIGTGTAKTEHRTFLSAASNFYGGLHGLYRGWGVSSFVDENLLMPLAINCLYLTGLNPSSLLRLQVDCLREEHPLTGMPYLLFEKERSGGEKELHLPLLERREERGLKRKQTLQVKRAISTILKLTERVRCRIPVDAPLHQFLFIYESTGQRVHGQVRPLTVEQTSAWCRRMVEKYGLLSDSGTPLTFNLARFRSTKLTEMALEGRDFFEIQQVARHKSITQTVRYIAVNRLDEPARKVVSAALQQIRSNQQELRASLEEKVELKSQSIHLFKGLIADCKNVFDPPDRIKRAVDYVSGQACTRFNMCLFCRNVVVLKEHLPALAAYRAQIMAAQSNNVQNLPHAHLYNQTLSILDNLLDPNVSQFNSDDIEWALDMATSVDMVVDPLLYHGVCK